MKITNFKIAGASVNQTPLDWENNLKNIVNSIEIAKKSSVEFLLFPELCLTAYGCEDLFLHNWFVELSLQKLFEILPHTQNIAIAVGLPINFENKTYNCLAIIENEKIIGIYAKHHLANDGVHYEKRWFHSWKYGEKSSINIKNSQIPFGCIIFEIKGIKIGVEICEDAWNEQNRPIENHPQIDIIINASASHFSLNKNSRRKKLVVESSKKYNCTYLYCNLLGNEAGRIIYDGNILIAKNGKLLAQNTRFSFHSFEVLSLNIDLNSNENETSISKDYESHFEELNEVLPLALFDYLRKSKSKGFVLSLSGGADSSFIACMVSMMIKKGLKELELSNFLEKLSIQKKDITEQNITSKLLITAYQKTLNSSKATFEAAQQLSNSIGATFFHWNIDSEVDSITQKIESSIGYNLNWKEHDLTLQNIQARIRSPFVWMLANINNFLLLATSNRSEGSVGYATMDGDTSGSISPIAGLSKVLILNWLKYAEKELGFTALKYVNNLEPTAELKPKEMKQKDEDDLMPYQILLEIETLAIRDKFLPFQIFNKLKKNYPEENLKLWISKFFTLWTRNQWKRERFAPSFHLDEYNIDPRSWCRFPILSGKMDLDF